MQLTENELYGVWLQRALGEGSQIAPKLLDYFGSCKAVYDADEDELRLSGLLGPKEVSKISDTPLDAAEEILEACERLGYRVMTPEDKKYPLRLRNIADYPVALYICGELPDIDDELCIAMVGTRRASRYGYTSATSIAADLTACGAIVVSGCARGIDTAAHQGALMAGGKTIAVLGCGINVSYNMENAGLRKIISSSGALISEYPPGSPPLGFHFPIRNRIISALSVGVVVIEAGVKSGSLITANVALEQGKDVFALPGEVTNYNSKGTNRLILDGAKPIENADDVLAEYVESFPHRIRSVNLLDKNSMVYEKHVRPKWDKEYNAEMAGTFRTAEQSPQAAAENAPVSSKTVKPARSAAKTKHSPPAEHSSSEETSAPIGMSENAVIVCKALTAEPKHFQLLLEETGLEISELTRCITELELYSAIRTLPGNQYVKN